MCEGCKREKKKDPCVCFYVYRGICLHLPAHITLHKHTPNINTHTHTLKRKGSLDYVGSEGWTGKPNSSWNNRGQSPERGKLQEGRREGEVGWGITALRGAVQLQPVGLLSCSPFTHTHTNTVRHKQTSATVDLTMPASLAANHSAHAVLKGEQEGEKGKEMDEEMVVTLQLSIIELPKLPCPTVSQYRNVTFSKTPWKLEGVSSLLYFSRHWIGLFQCFKHDTSITRTRYKDGLGVR